MKNLQNVSLGLQNNGKFLMKNSMKKIILILGCSFTEQFLVSAEKQKTCLSWFASCFSVESKSNHSLGTVADKKYVRLYRLSDEASASGVLKENGFSCQELRNKLCTALVYEEAGIIKGVSVLIPSYGELKTLSVGKEFQRKGIGKVLVLATMETFKKDFGKTNITLQSRFSAKKFYEDLGFVRQDHYYLRYSREI